MKDTRILTEGAILALLYTILLLISIYVPFISALAIWALPLPFVVYVVRRGLKPGGALVIVAALLTLIVAGVAALPVPFIFGTVGIVVGELFRRNMSGFSVLLGAWLTYTIHMLIVYLSLVLIVGIHPIEMSIDMMKAQMETTRSVLESFGQSGGQLDEMENMLDRFVYLAPFMLVSVSVILALATVVLSTWLLRRLGHNVKRLPPFREWTFPRSLLWYYLAVLLLIIVGAEEGSFLYVVIWNLFPLLELVLTVQGLAFIFYYCYEKKVATAFPVIITIVSIIITPLLNVVRILGIIDLGFDLRKRVTSLRK